MRSTGRCTVSPVHRGRSRHNAIERGRLAGTANSPALEDALRSTGCVAPTTRTCRQAGCMPSHDRKRTPIRQVAGSRRRPSRGVSAGMQARLPSRSIRSSPSNGRRCVPLGATPAGREVPRALPAAQSCDGTESGSQRYGRMETPRTALGGVIVDGRNGRRYCKSGKQQRQPRGRNRTDDQRDC